MHLHRWLTALVLLPILLLILLKGGRALFALVILLVSGLGQWEFLSMFQDREDRARKAKVIILGSLLVLSFCTAPRQAQLILFALVWCLFAQFLFFLFSYEHIERLGRELAFSILGLLYPPFLLGHFIWLRFLPQGEWWVLWFLLVVFAGDTAAFYCGRAWGDKKLYPQVSPGKTWVGTCGGLAASLIAGVGLGFWLLPEVRGFQLAWLSLFLGILGLLGDLFESMLKRQAQQKDASQILPGHGGMLDRLDSLLFAGPAVLYVRLFLLQM